MTQEIIHQNGSTPGFGWYNISLARAYLYDGQLDSSSIALDKASNFKELHIGTTLTQTQYEFTINLLKVQVADKKISQIKFLNRGWWYSPADLYEIASLKIKKIMAEYVVVNELAYNPERNRLVYDLFCAESTSTFDEAWYLLKDFSPKFFQKKYDEYQDTDNRINIQRYFKLFSAKFKWQDGKEEEAKKDFESIASSTMLDTANEKLFLGRLYEGLSKAYGDSKQKDNADISKNNLMDVYPQLIPFSGLRMPLQLNTSGANDNITQEVIGSLKNCNIDFSSSNNSAVASIRFNKSGDKYEAVLNVRSATGKAIVSNERLVFTKADGVGKEVAMRIFGKGGARVHDKV
jgi:hypothetical protein